MTMDDVLEEWKDVRDDHELSKKLKATVIHY